MKSVNWVLLFLLMLGPILVVLTVVLFLALLVLALFLLSLLVMRPTFSLLNMLSRWMVRRGFIEKGALTELVLVCHGAFQGRII